MVLPFYCTRCSSRPVPMAPCIDHSMLLQLFKLEMEHNHVQTCNCKSFLCSIPQALVATLGYIIPRSPCDTEVYGTPSSLYIRTVEEEEGSPLTMGVRLFETEELRGPALHRVYALTVFSGICMVWWYRISHLLHQDAPVTWAGMLCAELWYGIYWFINQFVRWNPVRRRTFIDKLSERLPGVDVFVCTADPVSEPPSLVISTVLSVMAYNYPTEKLSIYLSDDAGSILTFYAMWEASRFAKHWLPFCRRYKVEPRSPAAYFSDEHEWREECPEKQWAQMKSLYNEMVSRINSVTSSGRIPEDIKEEHKGFTEWRPGMTKSDHHPIVEIVIDGKEEDAVDKDGTVLPTLVYMAREKRPNHNHNFKAGAMNALIRVSSVISNHPIILNVDCDMYSNNSDTIKDALCFFLDEEMGNEIGFVQYPQGFHNLTKNDIYGNSLTVPFQIEMRGLDSFSGPVYAGTGCFHRREILCGKIYSKDYKEDWSRALERKAGQTVETMEDEARSLITCNFEHETEWGNKVGLKYGCAVEDVITGLLIQVRGWKSVYSNPARKAFLGLAPTTLAQTLLQHKRWGEGLLQIIFSKYNPFMIGHGRLMLGQIMGYFTLQFWPLSSLPTLYYVVMPSLCMLRGIPLFPKASSTWFMPFACVPLAYYVYSMYESLVCGDKLKGWWNGQRMWMLRRVTSYLYATVDHILTTLGISKMDFVITRKDNKDDESERYKKEIIDFSSSSANIIIGSIALLNALCALKGVIWMLYGGWFAAEEFVLQLVLCILIIALNAPVYEAMFLRKDTGRIPTATTLTSLVLAILACQLPLV